MKWVVSPPRLSLLISPSTHSRGRQDMYSKEKRRRWKRGRKKISRLRSHVHTYTHILGDPEPLRLGMTEVFQA